MLVFSLYFSPPTFFLTSDRFDNVDVDVTLSFQDDISLSSSQYMPSSVIVMLLPSFRISLFLFVDRTRTEDDDDNDDDDDDPISIDVLSL